MTGMTEAEAYQARTLLLHAGRVEHELNRAKMILKELCVAYGTDTELWRAARQFVGEECFVEDPGPF